MELNDKKRKYGRAPLSANKIRKNHLGIYLNDAELAELAKRAGTHIPVKMEGDRSGGDTAARRKIADYIRGAAFGSLPPRVPEVNREVWVELSKSLANLNQIAKKLNTGKLIDDMDRVEIMEILDALTDLRPKLIAQNL